MLASTQKEFAFRVLDAAVAPDVQAKPRRRNMVFLSVLVTGFLVVIFVFIWEGIQKRRADSVESNIGVGLSRDVA